jgi:DNA repair protein RadD
MNGPFAPPRLRPLRPYQDRAIAELRASLASGKKRPMLQLPTGSGKTLMSAHIVQGALGKGRRVAFVVPALSLIDQTVAAFEAEGISAIGVLQGIHERTDWSQPAQVCSVQTLARRKKPNVDLAIIDEAHILHKSLLKWMAELTTAGVPIIGLSATPWTRGLGRQYDDLIIAATTAEVIRDGYLSTFIAFAPSDVDLSGVSTVAGEFKQDELGDVMDRASITGDIVRTWLERAENRPTLAYCVNRRHAQHIADCFAEAGVPCEYMDGLTSREDREASFERFRLGETRILVNVGVLTTGIDLDVRCVVDAKPTKSQMLFVQTIGRGLRTAPGKDHCIILDHAGNHLRLGLVTDIGQDKLDDGKERQNGDRASRERSGPLPRSCRECTAVVPRRARECPACGALIAVSEVMARDGELVELGSRKSGEREPTHEEKRAFFRELLALKKAHYKEGWAPAQFRNRFGHWPPLNYDELAPAAPSLATRNWLKSREIAYAKRRAA